MKHRGEADSHDRSWLKYLRVKEVRHSGRPQVTYFSSGLEAISVAQALQVGTVGLASTAWGQLRTFVSLQSSSDVTCTLS